MPAEPGALTPKEQALKRSYEQMMSTADSEIRVLRMQPRDPGQLVRVPIRRIVLNTRP